MMKIEIEIDEKTLARLVLDYVKSQLGDVDVKEDDIKIEVITKENYRADKWENGRFRARVNKTVTK